MMMIRSPLSLRNLLFMLFDLEYSIRYQYEFRNIANIDRSICLRTCVYVEKEEVCESEVYMFAYMCVCIRRRRSMREWWGAFELCC